MSHTFSMSIRTDYRLFTHELNHTLWWIDNMTSYFNQSTDDITLLSVTDGSVVLTWSSSPINKINPPYTCPIDLITNAYNEFGQQQFRAAFPQYLIQSVDVKLTGICEGFSVLTTTTTTQSPVTNPTAEMTSSTTSVESTSISSTTATTSTTTAGKSSTKQPFHLE